MPHPTVQVPTDRPLIAPASSNIRADLFAERNPWGRWPTGSCRLTPPTGGVTKEPRGTTSAGMTYFVFTGLVRPSGGSSGDDE